MKRPFNYRESHEKRDAFRVGFTSLSAVAMIGARRYEATIEDLSPGGAGLAFSAVGPGLEKGRNGELSMGSGAYANVSLPFFILNRTLSPTSPRVRCQVRFDAPSSSGLRGLSGLIVPRYLEEDADLRAMEAPDIEIRGVDQVRRLLGSTLVKPGRAIGMWRGDHLLLKNAVPVGLERDAVGTVLVIKLPRPCSSYGDLKAPLRLSYSGELALHFMDIEELDGDGDMLRCRVPGTVAVVVRRLNPRLGVNPGQLSLDFAHPRINSLYLSKQPTDMSLNGLSFPVIPDQDLLFPGESIRDVRVSSGDFHITTQAVIRSLRADDRGNFRFGLELLTSLDENVERQWGRLLYRQQYPLMALGQKKRVADNFDVMERSGYLAKIGALQRERVIERYTRTWSRLAGHEELATFMFYPDPEKAADSSIGTVSFSRLFSKLWVVHQLGIDKDYEARDPRLLFEVGKQLYGGIAAYTYNTNCPYFIAEFKAWQPWNVTIVRDFIDSYVGDIKFLFDIADLFRNTGSVSDGPLAEVDTAAVRQARPDDLEMLGRLLKAKLSPIECDGFDYTPGELTLSVIRGLYDKAGVLRRRDILVAGEGKERGFAVCEVTEPGVNLFGIFNRVRLFLDDVPLEKQEAVVEVLLAKAMRIYEAEGIERYVVLDHERAFSRERDPRDYKPNPMYARCGLTYVEAIWRWLAPREVLPFYRNHMTESISAFLSDERQ